TRERMQRAAMMTGWQIRRPHHRQRAGQQHVSDRRAGVEPFMGASNDVLGRRLLDEADERFDGVGVGNGSGHDASSGCRELRASVLVGMLRHLKRTTTVIRSAPGGAGMRPNKIKQLWREGRCVTMGWLSISNGFTAEVMARQGFDALVVDMQHGLTDMAN